LNQRAWTLDALCADAENPDDWFPQGNSEYRDPLLRPNPMLAYLTCTECPVRRRCLREALTPKRLEFSERRNGRRAFYPEGTWGATTDQERRAVRGLPVEEAIDLLENTLSERVRIRAERFMARYPRGALVRGGRPRARERVWAKLDEMGLGKDKPAA
jgi:hypothetical protein